MDTIEKRGGKFDPNYKRYYKNNILLGTGTYRYRPYTVLTPTVALTFNLTGCSTTATRAKRLGTTSISFTKSAGYNWPTAVQVTGATIVSWNQDTGVLAIEKPTLDTVTITVACTKITYAITENLTNVTATGTHPTSIAYGESATLIYAASTNYALPDTVTVTGATYTWASDTGTLVLSNPTGAVTITITGVASAQKLATPQNLSISGDTLTFEAVDHAEEYEVYANGTSIGTYPPAGGTIILTDSSAIAGFEPELLSGTFAGTPTFYTAQNDANKITLKSNKGYNWISKINATGANLASISVSEFLTDFNITETVTGTSLTNKTLEFASTFSSRLSTTEGTDGGNMDEWDLVDVATLSGKIFTDNSFCVIYNIETDTVKVYDLDVQNEDSADFIVSGTIGYNTLVTFIYNPDYNPA